MQDTLDEIAAQAAALTVEEGLDFGAAKRKAAKQMGLPSRTRLPDNDLVEAHVRDYLRLYCADSQPQELLALRRLALTQMQVLLAVAPEASIYLAGAAWHGTATAHSDIHLRVYCDDLKLLQIGLINRGIDCEVDETVVRGHVHTVFSWPVRCADWGQPVIIAATVMDKTQERGALHPDTQGRKPLGSPGALQALIDAQLR